MRSFLLACAGLAAVTIPTTAALAGGFGAGVDRGISAGAAAIHGGRDHSSFHPSYRHDVRGQLYRSDVLPYRSLYSPYSNAARYRYAPLIRHNGYGFGFPSYRYRFNPRVTGAYLYPNGHR